MRHIEALWSSEVWQKYVPSSAFPGLTDKCPSWKHTFFIKKQVAGVSSLVHPDLLAVMKDARFLKVFKLLCSALLLLVTIN